MTRRALSVARRNRPACGTPRRTRAPRPATPAIIFSHPPLRGGSNPRSGFGEGEAKVTGGNGDLRALAALLVLWALCAFAMRFA